MGALWLFDLSNGRFLGYCGVYEPQLSNTENTRSLQFLGLEIPTNILGSQKLNLFMKYWNIKCHFAQIF